MNISFIVFSCVKVYSYIVKYKVFTENRSIIIILIHLHLCVRESGRSREGHSTRANNVLFFFFITGLGRYAASNGTGSD